MATSEYVLYTRIIKSQLENTPITDGQLIFVTDTKEIYLDNVDVRINMSKLIDSYTKTETNTLLDLKAYINSPNFTGVPTTPTAISSTKNTTIASCEFVSNVINNAVSSIGNNAIVYCWGDSLTEGVGGKIKQADNTYEYEAYSYPAYVSQTYNVINLGSRGEDIYSIMARQGVDPVVVGGFTIPASKDTGVKIGEVTRMFTYGAGTGLTSKNGNLVKWNKEVESAGLNINGIEGTIYRQMTSSYLTDTDTYEYYFKRLEDGTETVVLANTEVETYAMRYYRNGYAIFWMGANGGYTSHQDFVQKILNMVEYGKYNDYLVILSREFSETYARDIMTMFTEANGFCHVLYLPDLLPDRGYMMAGLSLNYINTSAWTTTDKILLKCPLLCDYVGTNINAEASYSALHYSAWGYKAIGKLVVEKLAKIINSGSGSSVEVVTEGDDTYGHYVYKLPEAKTLTGLGYLNTHIQLYDNVNENWTIVCQYHGSPYCSSGFPYNILNDELDGSYKGLLLRYTEADTLFIGMGTGGFNVGSSGSNTSLNSNGTNNFIIVKNGNAYSLYFNNTIMAYGAALVYAVEPSDAFTLPLIAGGRWNTDGTEVQYLTSFNLDKLTVYNSALTSSQVVEIYNDLIS